MAIRALLVLTVAVAAVLGAAHGASYTVGAPAGSWDLQTNYTTWASGINFLAGDQLGAQSFIIIIRRRRLVNSGIYNHTNLS